MVEKSPLRVKKDKVLINWVGKENQNTICFRIGLQKITFL